VFLLCFTNHWSPVTSHYAFAEVPHLVRYQGQAVDSQGVPLEGPYDLTVRLYDAETGGTVTWQETHDDIPITGGHFSILLGSITPLDDMDWNEPCWLSIQLNDEAELSPRQRITSVPLALMAEQLDGPITTVENKVGIGTTTPARILHVSDPSGEGVRIENPLSGGAFTEFVNSNGLLGYVGYGGGPVGVTLNALQGEARVVTGGLVWACWWSSPPATSASGRRVHHTS